MLSGIALLSLVSVLSYNVLSHVQLFGNDLHAVFDYIPNQILLPLGGLLIAVFAGWFVSRASAREELAMGSDALFDAWRFLARYVASAAVLVIFLFGVSG